jgi:hypothetical protein
MQSLNHRWLKGARETEHKIGRVEPYVKEKLGIIKKEKMRAGHGSVRPIFFLAKTALFV